MVGAGKINARNHSQRPGGDFGKLRQLLLPDSLGSHATLKGTSVLKESQRAGAWHHAAHLGDVYGNDGVWYATPETAVNWADLEWFGPFKSRAEAAMFLTAMAAPKPRTCPCCHGPVIIGQGPEFMTWQRDGITPHSCAGATVAS